MTRRRGGWIGAVAAAAITMGQGVPAREAAGDPATELRAAMEAVHEAAREHARWHRDQVRRIEEARAAQRAYAARERAAMAAALEALLDAARPGYVEAIRARVEAHWERPEGTAQGLRCTLRVTQRRGGRVVAVGIEETSGDGAFDAAAKRAVEAASPLPVPAYASLFEPEVVVTFAPETLASAR